MELITDKLGDLASELTSSVASVGWLILCEPTAQNTIDRVRDAVEAARLFIEQAEKDEV
ncbi:MAG: hypothetical protein GY906_23145 [bacterium]|nr:hypothetical protein [bacterium]